MATNENTEFDHFTPTSEVAEPHKFGRDPNPQLRADLDLLLIDEVMLCDAITSADADLRRAERSAP